MRILHQHSLHLLDKNAELRVRVTEHRVRIRVLLAYRAFHLSLEATMQAALQHMAGVDLDMLGWL